MPQNWQHSRIARGGWLLLISLFWIYNITHCNSYSARAPARIRIEFEALFKCHNTFISFHFKNEQTLNSQRKRDKECESTRRQSKLATQTPFHRKWWTLIIITNEQENFVALLLLIDRNWERRMIDINKFHLYADDLNWISYVNPINFDFENERIEERRVLWCEMWGTHIDEVSFSLRSDAVLWLCSQIGMAHHEPLWALFKCNCGSIVPKRCKCSTVKSHHFWVGDLKFDLMSEMEKRNRLKSIAKIAIFRMRLYEVFSIFRF